MKRISPGTVTVVVLAIVCGLVAAYVVRQSMQEPPVVEKPAPPAPTKSVVVARVNLPQNTVVRSQDLQTVNVPLSRELPEGALSRAEVAAGRIVKQTIKAGQIMNETYLLGIGESLPGLAERLPPGHRAVTITVDQLDQGGGLIEEGSQVDVTMSVEGDHPDLGELQTRTLLRGVPVVDVAEAGRRGDGQVAVTLAVLPLDANRLITARETGKLAVSLVSAQGGLPSGDDSVTRRELLGLRDLPPPPTPPTPPAPPQPYRIEQWRGNNMQVLEFDREQETTQSVSAPNDSTTSVVPGRLTPVAAR